MKKYSIEIKNGHHVVDMSEEMKPTLVEEYVTAIERAAAEFGESFDTIINMIKERFNHER